MRSSAPASNIALPRTSGVYYGWIVLTLAAAAMVGTLPARTQGLGLITEPLLRDLHLDRVTYAQLNFWATLIGSAGAFGVGRAIDRYGSRVVLTVVAAALGVVVCCMSQVTNVTVLAVWLTLSRALGQSALSVVSIAIVGHWFVRRIDAAMAAYSIILSVGFMVAFPVVGAGIQRAGWRAAWLGIGITLIAVLTPAAWIIVRRNPEAIGLMPDGDGTRVESPVVEARADSQELDGWTWRAAVATPAFWVFAVGAALYGLIASGIGLFNESILAQRGLGSDIYYRTLVVTALSALAGNFLGGWLAAAVRLGRLLAASQLVLAAGLVAVPHISTSFHAMVWATAMGLGGGLVMVLFFSVWPRVFGRRELGRIQGTAQALTVLASAVGPVLLAWCVTWTGSYDSMFRLLSGVVALVAGAALVTRAPEARSPSRPAARDRDER
jgi:MFS family permease